MYRVFFAFCVSILVGGCATHTPPVTEYTLAPTFSSTSSEIQKNAPSILLLGTRTSPSLASKSFFYLKDNHEIGHYLYSRWNDSPTVMIDRFMAQTLSEAHLFSNVVSKTSVVHADFALESTLNSFYHRIHDDGSSDAHINITYLLIDQKTRKSVASQHFAITVPVATNNAQGGVRGLNEALTRLGIQCTTWLNTTLKEITWTK